MHSHLSPPDANPAYGNLYFSKGTRKAWVSLSNIRRTTTVKAVNSGQILYLDTADVKGLLHLGITYAQLLVS